MADESGLRFENFRIDLDNECLWRGAELLSLTPKAFAVLRYLIERPGQLVSKAALLKAVWPDIAVGDAVLTVGIGELRRALHDNPQTPRFIETVHRRGYRFLGKVVSNQLSSAMPSPPAVSQSQLKIGNWSPVTRMVGREAELTQLHSWLEKALGGERHTVFVTGEPGIGKTTAVEAFLEQVAVSGRCWLGQGQCIEHFGAGEAYFPVFAVLGQLCRTPQASRVRDILSQYAPTWLVQMPGLVDAATLDALQRQTQGATRERMLREIAEAVEALTIEQPLVLVLEDLHWSDYATLDLLSFLARRRHPARLLVIGTYRPTDAAVREHPLRTLQQDLQLHGLCEELLLKRFSETAVEEYLATALPRHHLPATLAGALHRRTSGNPLFLVNVIQDWVSREVLTEIEGQWELQGAVEEAAGTVPPSLRRMIEQQLVGLSPSDQRVLEAASVVGEEFSAAIIAAVMREEVEEIEERCEGMVRQARILESRGTAEWPDGMVAARYGFVHALYQEVLYERVTAGRRVQLHRRIGQRLEAAYAAQAEMVAAELAIHFEQGREYERAAQYLEQAARKALRRSAPHEATHHFKAALRLLQTLPDSLERVQQELTLQTALGLALTMTKGHAAQEVEQAYARAYDLCKRMEESPRLFPVLFGLWTFHLMRAEYQAASDLCGQLLGLAQRVQDSGLLVEAYATRGVTLLYLGQFVAAREHLEQSLALYNPQQHQSHTLLYGQDPGVAVQAYLALALWFLGYPEQALQRSREAVAYARELAHPFSLAFVLGLAGILYNCRREPQAYYERAEEVIALSSKHGLSHWLAQGIIGRSRALIQQGQRKEGVEQIQQILDTWRKEGKALGRPTVLAVMAEAYGGMDQEAQGLDLLDEALAVARSSGEGWWEAEVHRIRGELLLNSSARRKAIRMQNIAQAEECFCQAITLAQQQRAKSLELRAVVSLCRLWKQQGKREEARRLLAEIYHWFTEGLDTKDLQEAKALLEELT